MKPLKLLLTSEDLHTLALLGDTKRGTLTKVPKALLNKMIVDHGRLLKYVRGDTNIEGQDV